MCALTLLFSALHVVFESMRTTAAAQSQAAQFTDAEEAILSTINPVVFADDVVRFAEQAAKQVYRDWKAFKKDHALGAFEFFRPEAPE